jgi:hypothetical protein
MPKAGQGERDEILTQLIAKEDREQKLQRLIAEQNRDAALDPSPLDVEHGDRTVRAKEYKRV